MAVAFNAVTSASGFGGSVTLSHTTAGSDRALFVAVGVRWTLTIDSVTYNGVAMTPVETADTEYRLFALANPAVGANDVVVTISGGSDDRIVIASSYTGVNQATPYDGVQASGTGDTAPSVTVTSAVDNLVVGLSGVRDVAGNAVQTAGAGQTSRGSFDNGQVYLAMSDEPGAASVAFSYTRASGFFYNQHIVAVNVIAAGAAGPTITVQPSADVVLINGDPTRASAAFSVTATGTGSLSYDWELETSVGGGVYANLANGDGATWTGQTAASCSATFTVKTLTGRRVRCNVTDDNGTTTSTAVTLTVYTGPVLSKTSGTTNGSGVDTLTIASDYPNGVGEFTTVSATAGGITKTVAMDYQP